jgi:hypothetical protein
MRFGKSALIIFFLVLTTACATRGIPVIQQDKLDHKLSVLMMTTIGLSTAADVAVRTTLHQWRSSEQITYEWIRDVSALDEDLLNKIRTRTYDYIYVIGNSLIEASLLEAGQDQDSKWTLLQDAPTHQPFAALTIEHAAALQVDPALADELKNNWVKERALQSIEWVTNAAKPIPSSWAPSEEADHIILLDGNSEWYKQLQFQVNKHASKWIVFNTPVDDAALQRARSIGIPVVDFSSLSVELDWMQIWSHQLAQMKQNSWKPGIQTFTQQQMKDLKIK